jgi:short-subunit dehydrogenase|nr:SDR family NAD(P)-dependent oxidoreductase [Kofleriaceae bacterium]
MPTQHAHILVTGAAGAIGGFVARELAIAHPDARLTLVDRDQVGLAALAGELRDLGHDARAATWDLSRPDDLAAAYADITRDLAVDALVNCAGIMELRSLAGMPWALGDRLLDIDLVSPLRLMTLAVPGMRARKRGLVVNVASLAGVLPIRGATFYGAAKAGLAAASEIARIELAHHGVHVLTVYPGPVASGLERHARAQVPGTWLTRVLPLGDAHELARAIVRAAATRAPRVVYPSVYQAARALGVARMFTERFSPRPFE